MSSKNNETMDGAVRERRAFAHLSIRARLAICYTLSAFGMLATVTAVQYWILIRSMEWDEAQLVLMFEATLLVLSLGTLLFAVVGTVIAHRCLRPVHDLAQTAERITANNFLSRIDRNTSRWPKELTMLADSLYRMLFRIETSFTRCSQCAGDLAHELRNPIHNLMGEAELALSKDRTPEEYRQVLESSLEEYTRLSRMINELLFIARADNPNTAIEQTRLDVHGELEAVREFHEAQAQEQEITVTCEGRASLDAAPLLFRRAVSNLVSNALSHTQERGEISLVTRQADGVVEVTVRDTGCGIKTEDLSKIFDRYYRIERKKSHQNEGAGLGLAIVKSIMTLHGGSVAIESTEGEGTTVVLRFPARRPCARDNTSSIACHMPAESA